METPTPTEPTTFLERALRYAQMGIPVFPLLPREKRPPASMTDWPELATTDPKQIAAWNEENSDYNCALVALPGQFLFLEFDIKGGMKAAAAEMEQSVPLTRVHISGRGFAHYVFRATAYSDRLGNRQANRPEGGEWFSFRTHDRYVVGPGSIHPNGNTYKVARDIEPIPVPDWVCDWVAKHSLDASQAKEAIPVSEDFDFDEFVAHYGIDIIGGKDGWHTTRECPVAGYRHRNSVDTGFFYDGTSLGFHCFAQGCPGSGMGVGRVIRFLNESHDPYTGPIWDPRDDGLDDFADDVDDDESARAVEAKEPAAPALNIEEFKAATGGKIEEVSDATPLPRMQIPNKVQTSVVPMIGLAFDCRALFGRLGVLAETLEQGGIPLGFGYPSILTVASALDDVEDIDHNIRSNIYTALLGDVGCGKSAAAKAALTARFTCENTA